MLAVIKTLSHFTGRGHLAISPASFTLTHQSLSEEDIKKPMTLFENNSRVPRPRYYGLPDLCSHWSGVGEVRSNIRVGLKRLQSVPLCANVQFHLFGSSAIPPPAAGGRKLAPFPFQIPLHISLYLINLAIVGNRLP